ncbi:terminase [Deinococcus sp. HMF7620]|uniref:Terminase n=1 Tax=Deinococcus arboris TaxID=2682977 RepID=A0A7C9MAU1_9DEIO|nr:terminase [Deinococcus arboris]MVN88623.1 terminase [Deinococcus arboris]
MEKLPKWLKPRGYKRKAHAPFMRLINPQNGNTVTGESGDNIGRGGRNTLYFVDEHAAIERAESVDSALSENTRTIIYGSTPKGVGNLFFRKRFSGKISVFTFSWRANPDKNFTARYLDEKGQVQTMHPWYEWAVERIDDPVIIAQEIDIDYTASVTGVVIPQKWVQAAVKLELAPQQPRQAGLDVGSEEGDRTVYALAAGPAVLKVQAMLGGSVEDDVREEATRDQILALQYDKLGVGAGITRTLNRDKAELPFAIQGLANSNKPTGTEYEDRPELTARQRFANYAAELWWRLRLRFQRTWLRSVKGEAWEDDQCISLYHLRESPELQKLMAQLSQPTFKKMGTSDKIVVNKYGEGTSSPDYAEALMYAFAPLPELDAPPPPSGGGYGLGEY